MRRFGIKHLFITSILLFLVCYATTYAQEKPNSKPEVILKAGIDKAYATTKDTITYTLTLEQDPTIPPIEIPEIGGQIAGLRIISFGKDTPETEDGREIRSKWYKLKADLSGSYTLPALKIPYKDSNGTDQIAQTAEIFLEFSDSKEMPTDIRDIKGLRKITKNLYLYLAVLLLLLGGLGIFLFWRFKKNKKEIPIKIKSPHEKALEALLSLKKRPIVDNKGIKAYHFQLSEIIRTYIEEQFQIFATDKTTEELTQTLKHSNILPDEKKNNLLNLLKTTDIVKFTDTVFNEEKNKNLLKSAEDFIIQTKPNILTDEANVKEEPSL